MTKRLVETRLCTCATRIYPKKFISSCRAPYRATQHYFDFYYHYYYEFYFYYHYYHYYYEY